MSYISEFRKSKGLDKNLDLSNIQVAIECMSEAHTLSYNYLTEIDTKSQKESFTLLTHLNLISRIYEQIEGMLCCIATEAFTSAEVLARVVQESSINLMYMVLCGDERTIAVYMSKWYDEHLKKLNSWKSDIKNKPYESQVTSLIDSRISTMEYYATYIALVKKEIPVSIDQYDALWPKQLFKRFEALERTESYFSIYHRLSGSAHMSAEDTITFMMQLQYPLDIQKLLSFEAISYSVMMSRIVIHTFVETLAACCIKYHMTDDFIMVKFKELLEKISSSVEEISKNAGVPDLDEPEGRVRLDELQDQLNSYLAARNKFTDSEK